MVKHTLAWALIAASSLGAVYGMSNAATEAENTISATEGTAIVTPPPAKPKRTESGLEYFRFREGYLEWKIQHIYSKSDMEKEKFNIRCYGRTKFYDPVRKDMIEEINDEFSGLLTMNPEDEEGYAEGKARVTLRPEEMRYTLLCGWLERTLTLTPRDWPSNIYAKELKSLNASSAQRSTQLSSTKSKSTKKPITEEIVTAAAAGGKKTNKLLPGSTKSLVAGFTIDVKKKVRISTITLTSPKWYVKPGVLKHLSITLDGKQPDSKDITSAKNTLTWTSLGGYGLFDTVKPGKHLVEIKASIMNAPGKQVFSDAFKVTSITGVAGSGLKLKLARPVQLQTYTVPYDKNRTKKEDENLGP